LNGTQRSSPTPASHFVSCINRQVDHLDRVFEQNFLVVCCPLSKLFLFFGSESSS
jgi:hypothetical protein